MMDMLISALFAVSIISLGAAVLSLSKRLDATQRRMDKAEKDNAEMLGKFAEVLTGISALGPTLRTIAEIAPHMAEMLEAANKLREFSKTY